MKKNINYVLAIVLGTTFVTFAQSPVSGFMKQKGKASVALSYSSEKYNEVYLGSSKVKGIPIFNEVQNTAVNLYANYGITDKFEAVVSVPFIQSQGEANDALIGATNFSNKRSGIQDLTVFLKYKLASKTTSEATYDLVVSAGVQTPVGGYKADEGFQSIIAIGNDATKVSGLLIGHIKVNTGFFITGQMGYRKSNNQVPDALVSEIKAGYAASKVYFDAWFANQNSIEGTNILQPGFDGFFPATQVDFTRVGANLYFPLYKGIGINGGLNSYLIGKNVGKSSGFSIGLVSNF
jgi:hypothetical protein